MQTNSKPAVTVAAIIEQDGKFLFVEEESRGARRLNQPAGHLEAGETLLDAVVRETLEESGYVIHPTALVGAYQWAARGKGYVRFVFVAEIQEHRPDSPLDEGIIGPVWLSLEELRQTSLPLRSPLVLRSVEDYLDQPHYSLDFLSAHQPL